MFYNPINLREMFDLLDRGPLWKTSSITKTRNWGIEAREVENGFEVEIALPGYEKDEIHIDAESTFVNVYTERANKWGEKFSQRIAVPDHCENKNISAEYKNGILTIFFPVKEERNEKISIQIK
jgi:HSP20 family protein